MTRPRLDTDADFRPVATAVPEDLISDAAPRRRGGRLSLRQRATALVAAVAVAGQASVLAWPFAGLSEHAEHTPEPPVDHSIFPIDRMLEFDGGVLIFSYGERVSDSTEVTTYRIDWSQKQRPATGSVIDAGAGRADDSEPSDDFDLGKAIDRSRPIPERSTRARSMAQPEIQPSVTREVRPVKQGARRRQRLGQPSNQSSPRAWP